MDSTIVKIIGVLVAEGPIAGILHEMANECVLRANKFAPGPKQERWLVAARAIREAQRSIETYAKERS